MFKEFGRKLNFIVLGLIVLVILIGNNSYEYISDSTLQIDSGDTALDDCFLRSSIVNDTWIGFLLWWNGEY
jgi:hypothetical protein